MPLKSTHAWGDRQAGPCRLPHVFCGGGIEEEEGSTLVAATSWPAVATMMELVDLDFLEGGLEYAGTSSRSRQLPRYWKTTAVAPSTGVPESRRATRAAPAGAVFETRPDPYHNQRVCTQVMVGHLNRYRPLCAHPGFLVFRNRRVLGRTSRQPRPVARVQQRTWLGGDIKGNPLQLLLLHARGVK